VIDPLRNRIKDGFSKVEFRARKYSPRMAQAWMAGKTQSSRRERENFRMKKKKRSTEAAKERKAARFRNESGINPILAGKNSKTWDTIDNAAARARLSFLDIWIIRIAQKSLFFYMRIEDREYV